jgi:hypothetical protein
LEAPANVVPSPYINSAQPSPPVRLNSGAIRLERVKGIEPSS